MKNIKDETYKLKADDLEIVKSKRIVFVVDEAQRSQFGEMHKSVKNTFPYAMFFGFTGTDTSKDISLKTLDDVMNYEIDGERLVDICTKFTVIERTF